MFVVLICKENNQTNFLSCSLFQGSDNREGEQEEKKTKCCVTCDLDDHKMPACVANIVGISDTRV